MSYINAFVLLQEEEEEFYKLRPANKTDHLAIVSYVHEV